MQETVTAAYLREQAEKCVRLANSINDAEATAALRNMAMEYQIRANRLEESQDPDPNPVVDVPPPAPIS